MRIPLRSLTRGRLAAPGWLDHFAGCAIALGYIALLLATAPDLAMSRDESFYAVAADRYASWIQQAWEAPRAALQPSSIDRAWSYNHEHPPLAKEAFALSVLANRKWEVFSTPSNAYRWPGMLSAGLLLWVVYIFGTRAFDRSVGAFAALSLGLMPRFFYHAHLVCFDVPVTLLIACTTYAYWRSLERPGWAVLTGVAFGLSLSTKHNSWIVPGVLLIHWLWVLRGELGRRRRGLEARMSVIPWWLLGMLTLGPGLFVGLWPWLWHDTWARLAGYVRFHTHHEYYNMAYFGRNYFYPPFPISFPFVMTAFTVPLTTLTLAGCGLLARARAVLPVGWAGRLWPKGRVHADTYRTDVLLFGSMLAPLVVIAWPSTPVFGGTKHWFPSYPFLALFAGIGFRRTGSAVLDVLASRSARLRSVVSSGAAALLLLPAGIETAHSHPFGLSHYTAAAGGVPGAADLGMNRQFWGFTTGSVADWLRRHLPNGGRVWIGDTTWEAWQRMQLDGLLPANIHATPSMTSADYVLVHHELHFAEVEFQAWQVFGTVSPVHVLTYDGVPIVSIYGRRDPR